MNMLGDVSELESYTGKPCVYVRWIEEGDTYYVGRTQNLYHRYQMCHLREVIYFEEYDTFEETVEREPMLIQEFLECGIPLANVGGSSGRWPRPKRDIDKHVLLHYYVHGKFPEGYKKSLRSYYGVTYIQDRPGNKHTEYLALVIEYKKKGKTL